MGESEPKIISVDRIDGGIQIAFSNGREAFFGQELLYEVIDRAVQIPVPEHEDEEE